MSSCGHGSSYMFLPPSLGFLAENFPYIGADLDIDRDLLRCRFCDVSDTQFQCDKIESNGKVAIEDMETKITETKEILISGKAKEDLTNMLPRLKKKLGEAMWDTDMKILNCWMGYWAVWGPGDGPEREYEIFDELVEEDSNDVDHEEKDEEEHEEHDDHNDHNDPDFVTDFSDEKEEEVQPSPKRAGRKGKRPAEASGGKKPSLKKRSKATKVK